MERFIVEQSDKEFYTSHSGLVLAGACLDRYTDMETALKRSTPHRHGISHGDVVKSYIGLLCQGKSDFEAIEPFRQDEFFAKSFGIKNVPSISSLRQRLDEGAG